MYYPPYYPPQYAYMPQGAPPGSPVAVSHAVALQHVQPGAAHPIPTAPHAMPAAPHHMQAAPHMAPGHPVPYGYPGHYMSPVQYAPAPHSVAPPHTLAAPPQGAESFPSSPSPHAQHLTPLAPVGYAMPQYVATTMSHTAVPQFAAPNVPHAAVPVRGGVAPYPAPGVMLPPSYPPHAMYGAPHGQVVYYAGYPAPAAPVSTTS